MRIVHAIRSDGFAGVETHVARLAAEQCARGHRVMVIGGDPESMSAEVAGADVDLIPARTVAGVMRALRTVTTHQGPSIVHTHMTAAELAAVLGLLPARHRVVTTRHFAAVRGSSPLSRAAAALIDRRVTAQISVSRFIAERIDGASTVVLPGVHPVVDSVDAGHRDSTVLLVQRLEPEKETAVGLRAFARSGLGDRGWRLDVVGDGSLRADLENLAEELGIAATSRFVGRTTDVSVRMKNASVLLAPCSAEGLGMTVVEAMAAGTAIIATASGGHLETVGRVQGATLHPPGDDVGAARLLLDLADDPARRSTYGGALQDHQRRHLTLEAQAAATEIVYRKVL